MQAHIFNTHDLVHLMTAGLPILLALPLLLRPQRTISDISMAVFLLTQGVTSFYFVMLYNVHLKDTTLFWLSPWQDIPLILVYACQGPALLWYTYAIAGRKMFWHQSDVKFAIFLGGATALQALVYVLAGGNEHFIPFSPAVTRGPALIIAITFGIRTLLVLREYESEIRERYSNIDEINLLWLSYLAYGFVGVWIMRTLGAGIIASYPALMLIACMVVIGLGRRTAERSEVTSAASNQPAAINEELVQRLEDLMTRVRIYQDPNLNLDGLADSLSVSPRTVSTLINTKFDQNFFDYVNGYRVEDAKSQLTDKPDKTIQRIFEDAGFNSKSTFNAIFKKRTGLTPSEFRKQNQVEIDTSVAEPEAH